MTGCTLRQFVNSAIHERVKFLSPESYDLFFQRLREGKYQDFTSTPEADLGEE